MTTDRAAGGAQDYRPAASSDYPPTGAFDPGTASAQADSRSLGQIASDLLENASTLIRQEAELAKAEVRQSASRAGKGAGLLGGAGVAGHFALLFFSLALWWALAVLIGSAAQPALGWSGLIVGAVYGIAAIILMTSGRGELKRVRGLPRTADTISKIPNAVKGNEEMNR
ncbi:MAG: phage holin family protein [Actinomycetes bacterium]